MLDIVVFEEYWRSIKVSAYTDLYAYDPEDEALLFISLSGNEQAVKAISSAVIVHREALTNDGGASPLRYALSASTRW